MKDLLERRIDASHETDDLGAKIAPLQILVGGQLFAGAVKRSDEGDGFFEILTVGHSPDQQSFMVKVTFRGDACEAIFEPHEEQSDIFVPKKRGLVVPGVS